MNDVHISYTPPRLLAFLLGIVVFALYQGWWHDILVATPRYGTPVPLIAAIGFSAIIGYGLAMLWWLIRRTRGQLRDTFRPTRGRALGALALGAVAPIAVFSWMPWVVGGMVAMFLWMAPLGSLLILLVASLIAYPLAAMILRHTYHRRGLRFALFCLCFWTAYAFHMLWRGVMVFTL